MQLAARLVTVAVVVGSLVGCGAPPPETTADPDAGVVEGPDLEPKICYPGDSDPSKCLSCVGGIMKSWCASGEFCYGGTCKSETRSAGSPCTSSSQCATAYCTDGVCCNVSHCSGGCQACGAGGACVTKTGVAPKSCGLAPLGGSCGAPGCYGQANCSYPTTACTAQCLGDASTGFTFGGSGTCGGGTCNGISGVTSCGSYGCSDATGCKTSCASDADCLNTAFCDAGACKPKLSTGSPCVDDRACAASAGSCKPSSEGKRCCTASCASPQVCDTMGTGCVGTLPIGDACTSGGQCATGKCHAEGKCSQCLGDADCASSEFCDTATFKCIPRAGLGESCASSASCPAGLFCTEGVCCEKADCGEGSSCALGKKGVCAKKNGTACDANAECDSGHCVDGVCCDAACDGQCEACDVSKSVGKCVAVKGAPHGDRPACPGAEVELCARALCDGSARTSCEAFTDSDEACRAASCKDGVATAPASCTGKGTCPAPITAPCGGFACDAEGVACRTSCASDGECVDGFVCKDAKCEPKTAVCSPDGASSIPRDGAPKACAPFVCDPSTGNCFDKCVSSSQCASGFACDGTTCAALPASEDDGGGCAVRGPVVGGAAPFVIAALAALGAVGRRRRGRA